MKQTPSEHPCAASRLRRFGGYLAAAILLTQSATADTVHWAAQSGTGARYDSNVHFISATTGWFTAGTKVRKTTDGGANWVELNPSVGDGLTGIHFVDANTGWVSGYYGTLKKTTNGGASWSTQTPATGAHCWSVFALNSTLAWQAGSSGMLGRTTNGGSSWVGGEGNPAGNPGFGMYDVYFTDANTGYTVAGGNWSAKTVNGGAAWTQMTTGTTAQLYKVKFVNANVGWAVGANGTIIKTTNAGASWATQATGTTQTLTGVSFVDVNTGWVVGSNGTILHTVNGGTTWTAEASGVTAYLGDVHFVDAANGWVVGDSNTVLKYVQGTVTLIDDKFDDGNIATNTLGTGNGFISSGQSTNSTESGGFLNLDVPDSYLTRVYSSNSLDAVNPFQTTAAALTYKFGVVNRGADHHRLWIGYKSPGGSDHFYPNVGGQGLYLSVLQQNDAEDGWTNHGNLVAVSNTGVMTSLASWTWANPDALSGLKVKLTTTSTNYLIEFSEATGGVPTFVTGAAYGSLTGMGTISSNFNAAIHNQYWFDNGGGAKVDSILLQSGVTLTPPPANSAPTNITLSNSSIAENNTAGAQVGTLTATDADSGNTHTFTLVSGTGSTDNGAFSITGNALNITGSADFEAKSSYNIRIRATDSGPGNLLFEKQFTVNITDVNIPQTITFTNPGAHTFGDADFAVSATGGASGQPVTFSIVSGPASIAGDVLTITGAGSVTVRASQAGIADYSAAADVEQTFSVATAAQTISFGQLAAKTFGDAPFAVSATGGGSGEPVTFSIASGPASISGNLVTITGAGSVTVSASQAGSSNYAAATPVEQTFAVAKITQSITFTAPSIAGTSDTLTLNATGGASGNAVTLSVFSGPGSLAGNSLTFTGIGNVVVRASQAGTANYEAAANVDATINAVANAAPIAVDDAVVATTGTTIVYPLANDTDADGDVLTISAVSAGSVTIEDRTLIVPVGYTGTFSYTVSDGISSDTADVVVTAGTPVTARTRWTGLITDNTGAIVGRMNATRTAMGSFSSVVKVGTVTKVVKFRLVPEPNGTATVATAFGALTATEDAATGRLDISIAATSGGPITSSLRRSALTATAQRHNIALASIDAAIPGGGVMRVTQYATGFVVFNMTLPDGKTLSGKSDLADNGTFTLYNSVSKTTPVAYIGGELNLANLATTDVTGDLAWLKPAQVAAGIHQSGVNTVLTANGCIFAPGAVLPSGAVTLSLSGGNLAADLDIATTATAGKPALTTPSVAIWTAKTNGTFTTKVYRTPAIRVGGSGVYLPKSNSAWGYFPGTTLGGRIELK